MFYGTTLLKWLDVGSNYCRTTVFDIIALFANFFFLLLLSLFSVVVALGKEWLQMNSLLHFSSTMGMEKKCLHLLKISTMRCCGSWATSRNSQKLGRTCSVVACSCVIRVSTQRSMLAVCLCCYVFCVLWIWKTYLM